MPFLSRIHPLDLAVALVFLVVNIIVGFRYLRRPTFQEYAVGDKQFSTPVLTATIVATVMSGTTFSLIIQKTYATGLSYIIVTSATLVGMLITGLVIGPRMGKFLRNISVPDILGDYYGSTVQTIAGVITGFSRVAHVAFQFKVVSVITETLFGYTGPEVTIVIATLVILYSTSGGVRAVTFTDVVQFFAFGTLLPILALAVWNRLESPSMQVAAVLNEDPRFSFREVVQWTPVFKGNLVLMAYFALPYLPPQLFQRMVMARDVKQVRQSFIWATVLCLIIKLFLIWIGILLLSDQPGLAKEELIPHLVKAYTYPGLTGLLGVGVIALSMSTIDSILNSCAVVITNDVVPFLGVKPSLGVARATTLGLGFLALLLALWVQNMYDTVLLFASFYVPTVVVPALLTIFGFQTSRRVVLLAMGAGLVTLVSCLPYFQSYKSLFPGMLANLVVMLGAHYGLGEKGGWGHNPLPRPNLF